MNNLTEEQLLSLGFEKQIQEAELDAPEYYWWTLNVNTLPFDTNTNDEPINGGYIVYTGLDMDVTIDNYDDAKVFIEIAKKGAVK